MKTDNASVAGAEPTSEDAACRSTPRVADVSSQARDSGERHPAKRARRVVLAVVAVAVLLVTLSLLVCGLRQIRAVAPTRDFGRFASPELPLDRGLALVAVLAMDCGHCRETAQMIGTFDADALGLRAYFVLFGKPDEVAPFFEAVGATIPHHLATAEEYLDFVADEPAAIYLLEDGGVQAEWLRDGFNLQALRDELSRVQ